MRIEEIIEMERPPVALSIYVPGTRFSEDRVSEAPGAFVPYNSLLERTTDMGDDLTYKAMVDFQEGFTTRLHAGQIPEGTVASAVPSSTLRLPERASGSLLAVSI